MTNLTEPFRDARRQLGVCPDDDAAAIKRAYRKAVALAPPDRDPEGFRRVREAYELLVDPFPRAKERLNSPIPLVPAPSLPQAATLPSPTALATELLRSVLGALPRADLEAPAAPARPASNRPSSAAPANARPARTRGRTTPPSAPATPQSTPIQPMQKREPQRP